MNNVNTNVQSPLDKNGSQKWSAACPLFEVNCNIRGRQSNCENDYFISCHAENPAQFGFTMNSAVAYPLSAIGHECSSSDSCDSSNHIL